MLQFQDIRHSNWTVYWLCLQIWNILRNNTNRAFHTFPYLSHIIIESSAGWELVRTLRKIIYRIRYRKGKWCNVLACYYFLVLYILECIFIFGYVTTVTYICFRCWKPTFNIIPTTYFYYIVINHFTSTEVHNIFQTMHLPLILSSYRWGRNT